MKPEPIRLRHWPWGEIPAEDLRLFEDGSLFLFFLRHVKEPPIAMPEAPDDLEGAVILCFPPLGPTAEA